jgi:hypothetical protein
MASAGDQRALARTRRDVARAVRERRQILPSSLTARAKAAPAGYGERVLAGTESMPAPGTPEARTLARLGSLGRWGKADPAFYAAFAQYFYHTDENDTSDYEDEDE